MSDLRLGPWPLRPGPSNNRDGILISTLAVGSNALPIYLSTWYWPPSGSAEIFESFEQLLEKVDCSNNEFYLLDDINSNLLDKTPDCHTERLLEICGLYSITQLILSPTRITPHSETLLDVCMTTTPDKISRSGVVRCGINNHDLAYMIPRVIPRINRHRTVDKRSLKNFSSDQFINDLKALKAVENLGNFSAAYEAAKTDWTESSANVAKLPSIS